MLVPILAGSESKTPAMLNPWSANVGDDELEAAYREQIPVVYVSGRKAFKYHVDVAELHRRLDAAEQAR